MTDIAAAIARVQLRKLAAANDKRRSNARYYDTHLSDFFRRLPVPDDAEHVYHQYVIRVPAAVRDAMVQRLQEHGIGADVHYPIPVNRQPSFSYLGQSEEAPTAYEAAGEVLALPVHPLVGAEDRARVADVANALAEELG